MDDPTSRSKRDVVGDHFDLAQQGLFEEDISRNFAEHCVVLTNRGAFHGHALTDRSRF